MNFLNSGFEQCSRDVVGSILNQINKETGSFGVINDSDIAVVMDCVGRLARTCKSLFLKINSQEVTTALLKSLSNKYGKSCEQFAAELNTSASRQWLWNYIQKNGDAKAYQIIQEIYEIATNIFEVQVKSGKWSFGEPTPQFMQTSQGFGLIIHEVPRGLVTPFGEIKIYRHVSGIDDSYLLSKLFISNLKAKFVQFEYPLFKASTKNIYEIDVSLKHNEIKKIGMEEVQVKKGSENLIFCSEYGISSLYEIGAVKEDIPTMLKCSYYQRRSSKLIMCIWVMLEANRKGLDPTQKFRKLIPKIKKLALETSKRTNPLFTNISDASKWVIQLMEKLDHEKRLVIKGVGKERLVYFLNRLATSFFEDENQMWQTIVTNGVIRLGNTPIARCDLKTLELVYELVIKGLEKNWIKSNFKDFPDIKNKQSEENYVLFVNKEISDSDEIDLINVLSDLLCFSDHMYCYCNLFNQGLVYSYLWIKKDKLDEVLKGFNINQL